MTISNVNLVRINTTFEERDALTTASTLLAFVQNNFDNDACLMAGETGEIIIVEELARVRAILDFFIEYNLIEVQEDD